jgi:hypothetical protein
MAERILAGGRRAQRLLRPSPVLVPAAIAAATLVTWIVTVDRMQGMDAGPGTNLGGLGWFVGLWATMMLPSVMPMTLVFARASAERQRRGRSFVLTWVFISGYLAAWTLMACWLRNLRRHPIGAHPCALVARRGSADRGVGDRRSWALPAQPAQAQLPAPLPLPPALRP